MSFLLVASKTSRTVHFQIIIYKSSDINAFTSKELSWDFYHALFMHTICFFGAGEGPTGQDQEELTTNGNQASLALSNSLKKQSRIRGTVYTKN